MWVEWETRTTTLSKKKEKEQIQEGEMGRLLVAKVVDGSSKRYLGSIRVELLSDPFALVEFWRGCQEKMREWGLSDSDKWKVDRMLQKRVAKPLPGVVEEVDYLLDNLDFVELMIEDEAVEETFREGLLKVYREATGKEYVRSKKGGESYRIQLLFDQMRSLDKEEKKEE